MEEFKDASPPEELLSHLKLSDQKSAETGTRDAQNPQTTGSGCAPSPGQDPTTDECFHDCQDSFEAKEAVLDDEGNVQNGGSSSRKQTELDEEYLLELEKDMPEEEKQVIQSTSAEFGKYWESKDAALKPASQHKTRLWLPVLVFNYTHTGNICPDKTEAALSDCTKAVELDPHYIRALLRRAELYEKTEKLDEALEDYKAILEKDPSVHQAREACMRLPRQIEERNEKLKKEMLGKLKDLGNLVLRPFGLSTENFQIKQDSSTGSYSINFVQNPNNNR
ncbi:PREDICTED: tetratricopeptide repeat protein 1 [Lepidothrix coronata]|uniref:Tetratricopeptide repeat protein 1 n=1 Tax=Lepidothrix coronata TaxID=321398 RepID=A0A6J0HXS7_9PASS|nr:PREDICTED: tetratricopeptide repeat protein 1 [Lepidothrix coronata]